MPLTKSSTETIPDRIWDVYEILMEIAFGDADVSRVKDLYLPSAFLVGTAQKELLTGHQKLMDFFQGQRKEANGIEVQYDRSPIKSWHPTKNTYCIIDQYKMSIADEVFPMRMTFLFRKKGNDWLCEHVHASVPDRNVPEDSYWPMEELKRQNQILEAKVAERTRELEIEASVERIRGAAMGMQSSEDFSKVMGKVWEEMQSLKVNGFAGCSIMLFDEENTRMYDFSSIGNLENPNEKVVTSPHKKKKVLKQPWTNWKKQVAYFEMYLDFTKSKSVEVVEQEWKGVDENIRQGFLSAIASGELTQQWNTFGYFHQGYLALDLLEKPSEDAKQITLKMAGAMGLAFKRYEDLKQAEAQAREAKIEAALERVRSRTMAMQSSDELAEASHLLDQEVRNLGIKTWGCAFNIYRENDSIEWFGNEKGVLPTYTVPRKGIFKKYYDLRNNGHLHVQEFKGKQCIDHYENMSTLPVIGDVLRELKKTNGSFPEYQIDHVLYFKYGYLLFITIEPVPEAHDVFKRFAGVFEQTYTRFLDLQKAEAQAREAQIELALERIRATATAMTKSSDLFDIVVAMRNEFIKLGHQADYFWHMRWMPDHYEMSMTSEAGNRLGSVITVPKYVHDEIKSLKKWEKSDSPSFVLALDAKGAWDYIDKMNQHGSYDLVDPHAPTEEDIHAIGGLTFVIARTTHGEIGFSLPGEVPNPPQESIRTIERFAKVFDLAYKRFVDLEKAEAQAREAQIEAALERVRSRTMGMHHSNEFSLVAYELFQQLNEVGIIHERINIGIVKEEEKEIEFWVTEQGGKQVNKSFTASIKEPIVLSKMYKAWKSGDKSQVIDLKGKNLESWLHYLQNEIGIPFKSALKKDRRVQTSAFFSHGVIVVTNPTPLPDDHMTILQRFAHVFEQTYTRFLDLQKAEKQAREAQIETSLERVRAATMAMHTSTEVGAAVIEMFNELTSLGVGKDARCGIGILNEDNHVMELWNASVERDDTTVHIGKLDMTLHPALVNARQGWLKAVPVNRYHLKGKDMIAYYDAINNSPDYPFEFDLDKLPTERYHYDFSFKNGILYAFTLEVLSQEFIDIFSRFAKLFNQTYQRYQDLRTAEAQRREAQIELSLERIRAQASAMQQSTDLLDIMVTMRSEFVKLGHEAHYFWHMKWLPNRYEKAMTSGDGTKIGMVMTLPRHIHSDIQKVAKWEKGNEPILIFPMETEVAVDYVDKMISLGDFERVDPQAPTLDDVRAIGGLTFIMARTSHGEIGYSLPGYVENPPEEALKILQRFAKAFDLAYRRFEDLRNAEIQARESQIEAAVERVRAEAMAMHQPDDLVKVNQVMIEEIHSLGIKNLTGAAFILFDEKDILTMWDISDPGNMGNVRDNKSIYDPRDFDVLGDFWRRWKKGEEYFVIEYDFQTVTTALEEWKKVDYENYLNLKKAIDEDKLKTQWNPFASFSKGLLTLDLMSEPDDDTKNIMTKMAKTFDLAYQRFDDLQKAEEQAIQAKKQASLDRIRAEIASMRQKSDLEKLTPFIWMELSTLGVSFFRCGVFIMDARSKEIDMYLSTPMGDSLAVMTLTFDNSDITKSASQAWANQQVYREKWTKDQFIGWSKGLLEQGLIDSPQTYQFSDVPPEILCLQFLPFKQGMLYIGTDEFLDHNTTELVQDVADAFSIAYTRYEDFERLERAKALAENALGELRSTQSQLIHAEKMASLGELTAGIAHEIQNPLNFVNNFSDLNKELIADLKDALQEGDMEEAEALMADLTNNENKIIHHGKRAEDIVKGMLAHSRSGDGKKELTDINALADEFLRLSYHGLRAKDKSFNANFVADLDKSLPKIKVVSQDIGRVLLNLINNAFYATAEKLTEDPDYKPEVVVGTRQDEKYARITVRDNGAGIPKSIKEKIFQPFFTTKATGIGTGLGLSLSHDIIVKGHEGQIEVESEEGKGTTFTITLPI